MTDEADTLVYTESIVVHLWPLQADGAEMRRKGVGEEHRLRVQGGHTLIHQLKVCYCRKLEVGSVQFIMII